LIIKISFIQLIGRVIRFLLRSEELRRTREVWLKLFSFDSAIKNLRSMKRTFIAIKINPDESLRLLLEELRDELSESRIKWVETENIHITLAFIGNTVERDIELIKEILQSLCSQHRPFPLELAGIDVFRTIADPRVVFLGITTSDALHAFREAICDRLRSEGLYNDARPFKPHLTIGRPKYISDRDILSAIIESYRGKTIQSLEVESVIYYESILKQEGPVYKQIGKYILNSSS